MNVFESVTGYVTKMISAGDSQGSGGNAKMKILLLDGETVRGRKETIRRAQLEQLG